MDRGCGEGRGGDERAGLEGLEGPGAYVLLFSLERDARLPTGALGALNYRAGWYGYVGSAMGGVGRRLGVHLRSGARPVWHVDYALAAGRPALAVVALTERRVECLLAGALARSLAVVPRFGSSDCRCRGHLFHSPALAPLLRCALAAVRAEGCSPVVARVARPGRWALGSGPVV